MFTSIALRASYNQIRRVIVSASGKRDHMIYMVFPFKLHSAIVALPFLASILLLNIFYSVRTIRSFFMRVSVTAIGGIYLSMGYYILPFIFTPIMWRSRGFIAPIVSSHIVSMGFAVLTFIFTAFFNIFLPIVSISFVSTDFTLCTKRTFIGSEVAGIQGIKVFTVTTLFLNRGLGYNIAHESLHLSSRLRMLPASLGHKTILYPHYNTNPLPKPDKE